MSDVNHLKVIEGEGGRAPSGPPPDPLVGRTIDGRYLVESVLGEGGMGLVYKARHTVLNKPLAIKVLRPEVSNDEEIITRFRQEAQSASAIGNQHIIDISDFGTLPDSSTYFVMEFLNGIDLTGAIEQTTPMDPRRAMHIAKQLCLALGAAHEAGIVHRDLKPDNIYLIKRGGDADFVKVLDFGIAKVGGGTKKLTKAGQVFGTPHYMSPEQCAGSGTDQRTDIYALGVILYEMACGKVPFDADNLMGVLTKHMYEEPIAPHALPPPVNVPPSLEAVILKCLAKQPDVRYQTMADVYQDLVRAERGETPAAVMDALTRSSSTGATQTSPTGRMSVTMGEPAAFVPTSKLPLILAGVGLLLLVGVVGAVVAFTGDDETPPPPVVVAEPAPEPEPEPEPEVEAQQNVEEQGSTVTATVTLTSEPEGVEVYIDGDLVGNTPFSMPRPTEGSVSLTLRKASFVDQPVRISELTAENVRITLEEDARPAPVSTRGRTMRGRRSSMEEQVAQPVMAVEPAQTMTRPRMTQTEVLDPWAN
jgi:serine/threonine-protein kinase